MAGGSTTATRTNPLASGTEEGGAGGRGTDTSVKKDDKKGAYCIFGAYCPMLDKETLLNHLPALATVSLLGVTAINVLSSNQSLSGDDNTKHRGLRQFLLSMPYTLFLFAFAAVAAAVSVKRKPQMLGCAAGMLLVQLVCLIVMGGLVTLVRGEVKSEIVWPVTAGIIIILVVVWGVMCAYPKFLRGHCCCRKEKKKEKDDDDDSEKCKTCGGLIVNGRSPINPPEGAQKCQSCGGVAPASVDASQFPV